ncbi:basic helix-loop-helix (bHLH) DNA-bindingsuperfamily protein [Striga asiatica]|uniref:Basic helix-loop-helix (BHLH) DNA-bindingsuperfamily protein n=1 Tax=Striga asiatica TaxID=4170 RepID=A0A5A7RFB0_STRAF|nr:basic helix-loop-helix (bHLH) DNA-bindingsuperfamily protein [Striga asiatica]
MGTSFLRTILQRLCCDSPWDYTVFWKLKHQHEMVLVWEDGFYDPMKLRDPLLGPAEGPFYESPNKILPSAFPSTALDGIPCENLIGRAIAEMSSASHVVGKGLVGKTAFTGNARWIYSDNIVSNVFNSILIPECQDEWPLQFAAGIKTVLLLPVMPHGVLQLGSVAMVAEDAALAAYVKTNFEAHMMEASLYGSEYSVHQISTMFNFPDNLDQASAITSGKVKLIEDQNTTRVVQDFRYLCPRFVAHSLETWSKVDFNADSSSNKSSITSSNVSLSENLASSGKHDISTKTPGVGECNVRFESFESGINAAKISAVSDKQRKRKGFDSVNPGKLSVTKKKRIQERLKELRDLVPNSENCSIDGLLDKTVKHMLFLRNVTKGTHKSRHHKTEVDEMTKKPAKFNRAREKGTSWAVELGSEPQSRPVFVKDLNHPRQMLIHMACADHDRFLEIADVLHHLQLTILECNMEESSESSSWARFVVETNGNFHRLDIFWALMKLVQENGPPNNAKIVGSSI